MSTTRLARPWKTGSRSRTGAGPVGTVRRRWTGWPATVRRTSAVAVGVVPPAVRWTTGRETRWAGSADTARPPGSVAGGRRPVYPSAGGGALLRLGWVGVEQATFGNP